MESVYEALINRKNIDWIDIPPIEVLENKKIKVKIIFNIEPVEKSGQGRFMADILKKLAETGGVKSIKSPVSWQRNTRKDRDLKR